MPSTCKILCTPDAHRLPAQRYPALRAGVLSLTLSLLCNLPAAQASSQEHSQTRLTVATLHTRGDYGQTVDTTLKATLFRLSRRGPAGGISLTLHYLDITGPATAVYEDIDTGELFLDQVDDQRRRGLGDLVISGDRKVWADKRTRKKLSLGGSLKLPTGNEDKGLSNGATDVSLFITARARVPSALVSGQLGYQLRGDSATTDYDNRAFFSINAYRPVSTRWVLGSGFRYRQASIPGQDAQRSLSAFVAHTLESGFSVSLRATLGLSQSVADHGLVLQFSYRP